MFRKPFIILNISTLLIFCIKEGNDAFSADLKKIDAEIIPIASFLFTQLDSMRIGWYCRKDINKQQCFQHETTKPVGSLFVQLRPRKFEEKNQLALRVLRKKFNRSQLIKELNTGKELNHNRYLTIPFDYLIGAIQGEALRHLFPNDRVEFGGWLHQITYKWETPELISKSFTNSKHNNFSNEHFNQGRRIKIPWDDLRSDLQLQPLALKKPLFIKKDETGLRYAFYKINPGDTIYSSVVIRFIGGKKHIIRSQSANDLLILNGLEDAHQISNGQLIKIPLKLIKPEYFHQEPSIYSNFLDPKSKSTSVEQQTQNGALPRIWEQYNSSIISQR